MAPGLKRMETEMNASEVAARLDEVEAKAVESGKGDEWVKSRVLWALSRMTEDYAEDAAVLEAMGEWADDFCISMWGMTFEDICDSMPMSYDPADEADDGSEPY